MIFKDTSTFHVLSIVSLFCAWNITTVEINSSLTEKLNPKNSIFRILWLNPQTQSAFVYSRCSWYCYFGLGLGVVGYDLVVTKDNGDGLVFRQSATPSISWRRGASGPQFCGFSAIYVYTVKPPTTKFGVVTHGHSAGGVVRSATHLHKCVAR